jgi:hypothetical protein
LDAVGPLKGINDASSMRPSIIISQLKPRVMCSQGHDLWL